MERGRFAGVADNRSRRAKVGSFELDLLYHTRCLFLLLLRLRCSGQRARVNGALAPAMETSSRICCARHAVCRGEVVARDRLGPRQPKRESGARAPYLPELQRSSCRRYLPSCALSSSRPRPRPPPQPPLRAPPRQCHSSPPPPPCAPVSAGAPTTRQHLRSRRCLLCQARYLACISPALALFAFSRVALSGRRATFFLSSFAAEPRLRPQRFSPPLLRLLPSALRTLARPPARSTTTGASSLGSPQLSPLLHPPPPPRPQRC